MLENHDHKFPWNIVLYSKHHKVSLVYCTKYSTGTYKDSYFLLMQTPTRLDFPVYTGNWEKVT